MQRRDALALLEQVDQLYAAKGKRVTHVDLRGQVDRSKIVGLLLGPTGNLRAPTVRRGRTLLVGFDEDSYARVLGGR